MTSQTPWRQPDPEGDRRRAIDGAVRTNELVRDAQLTRDAAFILAIRQGATVADLATATGLHVEQIEAIVGGPAAEAEGSARAARRRQALKLIAHAIDRRASAEHGVRAAVALAVEHGVTIEDVAAAVGMSVEELTGGQ